MRNFIRHFNAILAVMLCCTAFYSCGQDADTVPASETEAPETEVSAPAPAPESAPEPEPEPEPETFSVDFNLNGGQLVSGEQKQTVTAGSAAAAPVAANGSKVLSWDTDFSSITENTIVTAVWTPVWHTVTFDPAMEGLSPIVVEVEDGTAADVPEFFMEGQSLTGWSRDVSNVTEDMTVSAHWERKVMNSAELSEFADSRIATVYTSNGSGSGFFIDDEGTLVTNYHIIKFVDSISIELIDGAQYSVRQVLNFSEMFDLAILQVDITGNDYFDLADSVSKGESVYAIGSPLGDLSGTITGGIVSSESRMVGKIDCIQMDASISDGNSGGPLLNRFGEVIGVNSFSFTEGESLNLAINIAMMESLPAAKNFTISDYVEWWRTEIERSYRPTKSSDNSYYTYSIVNTYQEITGTRCSYSLYDINDPVSEYMNGYNPDGMYFIYDYSSVSYDKYVKYLKTLGFEYLPGQSSAKDDGTVSYYYNTASGLQVMLWQTNEKSFLEDNAVIFSVVY